MPPEYRNLSNPRDERLADEHRLLDEFCSQSDVVSYSHVKRRGGLPPEEYTLTYKVKCIVGIRPDQSPIYGEHHEVGVTIPAQYPLGGQPECKMLTDVWHPNVNFHTSYKGRICINAEALGDWHTLDMLAERIGEMLQYKNYHAEHSVPYPEDAKVAQWVREYAQPRNIVNKAKRIYTDNRPLLRLSPEWEALRRGKIETMTGIKIGLRRPTPSLEQGSESPVSVPPPSSNGSMRKIVIRKP
jgi:ubiquitin-protein ligase